MGFSRRYYNANGVNFGGNIPAAPFGLAVGTVTTSSIQLTWKNADTLETSIEVQYRGSNNTWTALATLSAGVETYTNTGLSSNVDRSYRVRAVNGSGNSDWSNIVVAATDDSGAVLHTTGNWQKALRAWMGSFIEADFDVGTLDAMQTDFSSETDEDVWQAWYVYEDRMTFAPVTNGFRLDSAYFPLSAIEDSGNINMTAGRGKYVNTVDTAFYAYWNNPINPQYDRESIYLRAFVATAVDMIEATYLHDTNAGFRRSDYNGGWIYRWALVLWMYENHPGSAMTIITDNANLAFRQGIREMWDNIQSYNAGGNGGGDLEAFQLMAMPYLYDLGIITFEEYKNRAARVISEITNPRGGKGFYHDHGGGTQTGIDMSYEGIWYMMLSDAAVSEHFLIPEVRIVRDALYAITDLIAYTTLIDYAPNVTSGALGRLIGPSHFNTGSEGSLGYQFELLNRYWNSSFLNDNFVFHLMGWHRSVNYRVQKDVLSRADMEAQDSFGLKYVILTYNNSGLTNNGVGALSTVPPTSWSHAYFNDASKILAIHPVTGLWDRLYAIKQANDDENMMQPPILRTTNYIKNYEHMVSAKIDSIAAITHVGPVVSSWAGNPSALRGGLSAFWIKDRGIFVLGVGTGGQDSSPDNWSTHDTWAVNTVSGTVSGGQFSECRSIAQGLPIESVDAPSGIIVFRDSNNLTDLYKAGQKVTFEDWNTGLVHVYTLAEDATSDGTYTTMKFTTRINDVITTAYDGHVNSYYIETGDDYFIQESRSLIDETRESTSVNSASITDTIVRRKITVNSSGAAVEVEITSPGNETITDIWEQIPVYQGQSGDTYAIEYWNGSAWTTLSTTYVPTTKLRLTRDVQAGDGDVYAYVILQGTHNVKLNSAQVNPGTGVDYVRNVKIQLFDTKVPARKQLNYTIQASDS